MPAEPTVAEETKPGKDETPVHSRGPLRPVPSVIVTPSETRDGRMSPVTVVELRHDEQNKEADPVAVQQSVPPENKARDTAESSPEPKALITEEIVLAPGREQARPEPAREDTVPPEAPAAEEADALPHPVGRKKLKEIGKVDAARIREEFAEVGADDVLEVLDDPPPAEETR